MLSNNANDGALEEGGGYLSYDLKLFYCFKFFLSMQ